MQPQSLSIAGDFISYVQNQHPKYITMVITGSHLSLA